MAHSWRLIEQANEVTRKIRSELAKNPILRDTLVLGYALFSPQWGDIESIDYIAMRGEGAQLMLNGRRQTYAGFCGEIQREGEGFAVVGSILANANFPFSTVDESPGGMEIKVNDTMTEAMLLLWQFERQSVVDQVEQYHARYVIFMGYIGKEEGD